MLQLALYLVFAGVAFAGPAFAGPAFDGLTVEASDRLSDEELLHYFGVESHEKAPEYDIVYPQYTTLESKRHVNRSVIATSYLDVHVDAFGETIHAAVQHDGGGIRPGLGAEYVTAGGTIKVPVRTDCIYTGRVVGEPDSLVSLTACEGLMAIMYHATGPTFIEPLNEEHALKRDMGRGLPHVAYKRRRDVDARCPVTGNSKYDDQLDAEGINYIDSASIKTIDSESIKTIELGIVGDFDLYQYKGSKTHGCPVALFNAVRNIVRLDSLVGPANLDVTLTDVKVFTTASDGPKTSKHSVTYLDNITKWNRVNRPSSSSANHWDNLAVLTGVNMDVLGQAKLDSCDNDEAVSVSAFLTLDIADTVAHELAHNLGMYHDSLYKWPSCDERKYLMAPYAINWYDEVTWSTCSRKYYQAFIASHPSCFNDS